MLRLLTLMLFLVCAGGAMAGTMFSGPPGGTVKYASDNVNKIYLCFLPDVQRLTSAAGWAPDWLGKTCSLTNPPPQSPGVDMACEGGLCLKSVYCQSTWRDTDRRLLFNMGYEAAYQQDKIDNTGISDIDDARSFLLSAKGGFGRCNAVISLGDMADQPNAAADPNFPQSIVDDDLTYEAESEQTRRMWTVTEDFWRIFKTAGIPYLPVRGNHDNRKAFRRMMERLNFKSESFFHDFEPTDVTNNYGDEYSIKIPYSNGSICVVSLDETDTFSGPTAGEQTWVIGKVGCGGSFPTIVVQHQGVNGVTGAALANLSTVMSDAGTAKIFLGVGGHWANTLSVKVAQAGKTCTATSCWSMYSNWQDMNRHSEAVRPKGMATMDAAGGIMTIVRLDVKRARLDAWDWNVYYHAQAGGPAILITANGGPMTSTLSAAFDITTK